MRYCPSCGTRLDYDPDSCPHCLRPLQGEPAKPAVAPPAGDDLHAANEPLRSIARFTNAAEAGFFAHTLLFAEEIPATIRAEDNFDAVGGYWSTRYHLEVPERLAATAARTLQSLVERSEREDFVDSLGRPEALHRAGAYDAVEAETAASSRFTGFDRDRNGTERDGIRWGPIVITLAAGSLAFFGLRALQPARKPQADVPHGRQGDLWEQLARPDKPWVQSLDGKRRRELRINADHNKAVVREYVGERQVSEREFKLPARK